MERGTGGWGLLWLQSVLIRIPHGFPIQKAQEVKKINKWNITSTVELNYNEVIRRTRDLRIKCALGM